MWFLLYYSILAQTAIWYDSSCKPRLRERLTKFLEQSSLVTSSHPATSTQRSTEESCRYISALNNSFRNTCALSIASSIPLHDHRYCELKRTAAIPFQCPLDTYSVMSFVLSIQGHCP